MIPERPTKGWIGVNIRPGMTPGGFSHPIPQSRSEYDADHYRRRREAHEEVIEAANRVLEGRKVVEAQ